MSHIYSKYHNGDISHIYSKYHNGHISHIYSKYHNGHISHIYSKYHNGHISHIYSKYHNGDISHIYSKYHNGDISHIYIRLQIQWLSVCPNLTKIGTCQQTLINASVTEFHENPRVPCGQTDGRDTASSRFSQLFFRMPIRSGYGVY